MIKVIPWIIGRCSLYAIEKDGVNLPEVLIEELSVTNRPLARQLIAFIDNLVDSEIIEPRLFRDELPAIGVYAMYRHENHSPYSPVRLLCSFVGSNSRTMIVGLGFIKTKAEAIQSNAIAYDAAQFLGMITSILQRRIDSGEIVQVGSELIGTFSDSFHI